MLSFSIRGYGDSLVLQAWEYEWQFAASGCVGVPRPSAACVSYVGLRLRSVNPTDSPRLLPSESLKKPQAARPACCKADAEGGNRLAAAVDTREPSENWKGTNNGGGAVS